MKNALTFALAALLAAGPSNPPAVQPRPRIVADNPTSEPQPPNQGWCRSIPYPFGCTN